MQVLLCTRLLKGHTQALLNLPQMRQTLTHAYTLRSVCVCVWPLLMLTHSGVCVRVICISGLNRRVALCPLHVYKRCCSFDHRHFEQTGHNRLLCVRHVCAKWCAFVSHVVHVWDVIHKLVVPYTCCVRCHICVWDVAYVCEMPYACRVRYQARVSVAVRKWKKGMQWKPPPH